MGFSCIGRILSVGVVDGFFLVVFFGIGVDRSCYFMSGFLLLVWYGMDGLSYRGMEVLVLMIFVLTDFFR